VIRQTQKRKTGLIIISASAEQRERLQKDLAEMDNLAVIASFNSLDSIARHGGDFGGAVLLLDYRGLNEADLTALESLLERPSFSAVVLTDEVNVSIVASFVRVGAAAVLPRAALASEIELAALGASHGLTVIENEHARELADHVPETKSEELREELTPREVEVLQLMAQGLGNKTIAARLGISEHTAKFHVSSIFGKLGVSSRTEAVMRGIKQGLVLI
jgi:two-component system, NarL family, response regulator YdfI